MLNDSVKKDKGIFVLIVAVALLIVINGFLYWFNYPRVGKTLSIFPSPAPTAMPTLTPEEETAVGKQNMERWLARPTPFCEKNGKKYLKGDDFEGDNACQTCTCFADTSVHCFVKDECSEKNVK